MKPFIAFFAAFLASMAVLGLSGCGEKEQTVRYENGKYRGKPDNRPWDNLATVDAAGSWAQGDPGSWRNEIRARNAAGQNENDRIGH